MAAYDGSIRIGTGIDEKGFKAGSKDLEAGARRLAKSVSGSLGEGAKIALQKQTDAFAKLNQQYANQEQKVKDLTPLGKTIKKSIISQRNCNIISLVIQFYLKKSCGITCLYLSHS